MDRKDMDPIFGHDNLADQLDGLTDYFETRLEQEDDLLNEAPESRIDYHKGRRDMAELSLTMMYMLQHMEEHAPDEGDE